MKVRLKVNRKKFIRWFCQKMICRLDTKLQRQIIQGKLTLAEIYWECKYFPVRMLAENLDIVENKIDIKQGKYNWVPKRTDLFEYSGDNATYIFIEKEVNPTKNFINSIIELEGKS